MPKVIPVPDALSQPFWDAVMTSAWPYSTAPPVTGSSTREDVCQLRLR